MPWRHVNGKYVHYASSIVVSAPTTTTTTERQSSGDSNMEAGSFVEYSGDPSTTIGSFDHNNSVINAESHLQLAQANSTTVAGVVSSVSSDKYTVASNGVILAWVIRPTKRTIPLTGLYDTTVNGTASGKTVILVDGNSFIFARSKDNELDVLVERFNLLTGS